MFQITKKKGYFAKKKHFNLKNLQLKLEWRTHDMGRKDISIY